MQAGISPACYIRKGVTFLLQFWRDTIGEDIT